MAWQGLPRAGSRAAAEFDLLREVGRGSYGVVNKARRKRDGRFCVIKSVLLERLGTERERTQALNEAKIMKELRCPHIVEYLDAFTDQGALYLVLELCELGNLKNRYLGSRASVPLPTIWRIGLRITLGLEYLHARRILHRDVKCENVLLVANDAVRIADLGLAKQLSSFAAGASTLCGTPRYLSPEMAQGVGSYTDKCDVWALGVIIYELCSLDHRGPFVSQSLPDLLRRIQHQEVPSLPSRTDARLRELIFERLLVKDPALRSSASEVLQVPDVLESGLRNGVAELAAITMDARASNQPVLADSSSHEPAASEHGEVPDGFCTQICRLLCRSSAETSLGPRFHRRPSCELCTAQGLPKRDFTVLRRRHHCRNCGRSVCAQHCTRRWSLPHFGHYSPQRVCDLCSLIPASGSGLGQDLDAAARHWIVTVRSGSPALCWDSQALTAALWTTDSKPFWAGAASGDEGRVVCSLASGASACLELRAPETGEVRRTLELPLAADAGAGQCLPGVEQLVSAVGITRGPGLRISRAANVDAAACCGEWFAVARHDWQVSAIHVLRLPTGASLGHCALQDKVTALAVQDGPQGFVAAGFQSGDILVLDVPGAASQTCNPRCVLEGHKQAVTCMVVASLPGILCSGANGSLRFWKRQPSGAFVGNRYPSSCEDHSATGCGAIACAGTLLAFVRKPGRGEWERSVALWDVGVGRFERSVSQKGHSVGCVALCGPLLATSDTTTSRGGCTVLLWYAHTGTPLAVFRNPFPISQLLVVDGSPTEAGRGNRGH